MSLTFDGFLEARGLLERTRVNEVANIYWDADGNLRHGNSSRDRDAEVLDILSGDTSEETEEGRVWMIVPSRWVRHWLLFAHLKISTDAPGPINMDSLLQRDDSVEGGWRPKNTLLPPGKGADAAEKAAKAAGNFDKKGGKTSKKAEGKEVSSEDFPGHYRRISLEAWMQLVDLYGLTEPGFALAVRGTPYHDLQRWRVFKNPKVIDPSLLVAGDGKHVVKADDPSTKDKKRGGFLGRLFGNGK